MTGAPARKSEFFFVLLNIMGLAITQPKTSDASVQIQIEPICAVRYQEIWVFLAGCQGVSIFSGNCHVYLYGRIIIEYVHMCIGFRLQHKNTLDQSENCHDTSPVFFFCSDTTGACENDWIRARRCSRIWYSSSYGWWVLRVDTSFTVFWIRARGCFRFTVFCYCVFETSFTVF